MPIVKTTVTGPILDVTGTAYTKAVVRFTPRGVGGDDAADTVLAQTPVEVMPDASTGAFSIDLAPSATIAYDVVLAQFLPDRERVYKIGAIYVPSTGPVALEDLLPVFDPSLPTNAELLAALSAAVAEAEAAADRAEAAGNSFATIAALAAADTLEDGLVYAVDDGYNGQREYFEYSATSTATADGALIVDATGMGVGRLVSQRTEFSTVAELLADRRTFDAGTILQAEGYQYEAVASGAHVTNAGGQGLKVTTQDSEGYYPADAWGSDNAAFLAAVQAVGAVYLGNEARTINLGTSASNQALNRLEVKGGDISTDGWYVNFTGQLDRRFSLRNVKISGEDATGTDKSLVVTKGAYNPTALDCEFDRSQIGAITHQDHTGFPRHVANRFEHIGTQEKVTGGVNIGTGIYLFNGPVGEVLNNYFEDVWQIPIFSANSATGTFNIDGGLIAFNKIFGAMDNGIRTQPYANDLASLETLKNVTIAYNDLHGVNIDAIRHNGKGIKVVGNTYRDWTSSRHGLISASYMIKADNAADCSIQGNTAEDVPIFAGVRLEIPGASAVGISYTGNRHRGPNTAFGSIVHTVINEETHFEDISHTDNDMEGGWHGIAVTGLNPGEWTAGTYTTGTKKSQNGVVYKVIADPSTTDDPETGVAADPATWEELAPVSKGITVNGGRHIGRLRSGFHGGGFEDLTINGGEFEAVGGFNGINLFGVVGGKSVIRPDRVKTASGFGVVPGVTVSNVTTYPFLYETTGAAGAYTDVGTNNVLIADVVPQASVTDLTVTATTGTLPTANGSITVADAAAPTVNELLEYCTELRAKIVLLSDRLDAAGVTE